MDERRTEQGRSTPNDVDAAQANWQAFNNAYVAGHQEFIADADKRDEYYVGDQWDEETITSLGDRPALTINMSMKTINAIKGHYSKSRADIVFKPAKETTSLQAQLMTRTCDSVLEMNSYPFVEGMVFDDGIITDRGFLDVRLNFEHNIFGDIKITDKDPRSVLLPAQGCSYDPAEWPEVIVTEWWSPDDVEALYGKDKADLVRGYAASDELFYGQNSIRFGKNGTSEDLTDPDPGRIRALRIIDRQFRKMGMIKEFVDLATGDLSQIPDDWKEDRIQAIAQAFQLGVRKRMAKRIRWTVSCDHVTLFDGWSPYDEFTIVPFFPYFRRGKPAGVMKQLISPQDQLNKTESQMLHIVNTTANSGWVVESGSLVNMTPEELEQRGAETGIVIVHGRNRAAPTKIQPNQIPTGLDRIAAKAGNYLADIPGVSPILGQELKSDVPDISLQRAQSSALAGLQPIFDNLAFTRKLLARKIMSLVKKHYNEPRVMRATDWRSPEGESIEFSINNDLLDNLGLGKYDIVVSSAPHRDTFEERQFAQVIEMRNAGVMIPDHYVIKLSHLAQKDEIAEVVKQLQGLGEPSPEQLQEMQEQRELQMQMVIGQIGEVNAKIEKLRADAQLATAKAGQVMGDLEMNAQNEQMKREKELMDYRSKLLQMAANLENKKELAQMHIDSKERTTRYSALMKASTERMKLGNQRNVPTEG